MGIKKLRFISSIGWRVIVEEKKFTDWKLVYDRVRADFTEQKELAKHN